MSQNSLQLSRRTFLIGASVAASSLVLSTLPGCDSVPKNTTIQGVSANQILVAYFSRAGENESVDGMVDLSVGNTEVMANYIAEALNCDIFHIQPSDPYPNAYEATRQRVLREDANTIYPEIANIDELPNLNSYSVIFLGGPNWFSVPPMILYTFLRSFNFAGKVIIPFTTSAGGGLGDYQSVFSYMAPDATISGDGLSVIGDYVGSSRELVQAWAQRVVNA